jgi:hypothetical protein
MNLQKLIATVKRKRWVWLEMKPLVSAQNLRAGGTIHDVTVGSVWERRLLAIWGLVLLNRPRVCPQCGMRKPGSLQRVMWEVLARHKQLV